MTLSAFPNIGSIKILLFKSVPACGVTDVLVVSGVFSVLHSRRLSAAHSLSCLHLLRCPPRCPDAELLMRKSKRPADAEHMADVKTDRCDGEQQVIHRRRSQKTNCGGENTRLRAADASSCPPPSNHEALRVPDDHRWRQRSVMA